MEPRRLARESGDLRPRDFAQALASDLIRRFAPAPRHRFDGGAGITGIHAQAPSNVDPRTPLDRPHDLRAHGAGAGSLALEKFDGRILVSGGADGSIKIWDLEDCANPNQTHTFRPKASIARYIAPEAPPSTAARDGNIMVARGLDGGGGEAGAGAGTGAGDRPRGHSHGITHLAFYPFDPDAFLSSSYDKTLKLWSTRRGALSAAFDLNASIYSHATSPVGQHLTVACATQHSSVRLVDLRSGAAVQALVAHGGPVLCAAWSPRHEHLLASGHADGRARIWDVRRAGGVVAQLDQEDSLGVVHRHRHDVASSSMPSLPSSGGPARPRFRSSALAHDEAVNGLLWTDDGRHIVSAGLDRRIRVWDADRGANTLVSFGPIVQNQHVRTASFVVCPTGLLAGGLGRDRSSGAGHTGSGGSGGSQVLIWPNDYEILMLDLHGGTVLARLKSPGAVNPRRRGAGPGAGGGGPGEMANRNRITGIVWRGAGGGTGQVGPLMGGGGSAGAIYSAHLDGQIRAWMPALAGSDDAGKGVGGGDYDDDDDDDDELNEDSEARKRKRKAVDDAYRSLMGKKITFT